MIVAEKGLLCGQFILFRWISMAHTCAEDIEQAVTCAKPAWIDTLS
jgi:hypothetical protein